MTAADKSFSEQGLPPPRSVLVTGGSGFVGRQIVRCLLDEGIPTAVLCRSRAKGLSIDSRIDDVIATEDVFKESASRLVELTSGFDVLIHCAWCTDRPDYLTADVNTDCLEGTIRLAKAFAAGGGDRFIGLGTCAEYDHSTGVLYPSTALRPTHPYAACKAAAYLVLHSMLPPMGVSFTWCRLFYLCGEGERSERLLPTVRRHLERGEAVALTTGTQIRDFLDVRDAGRLIVASVLAGDSGVVNICSEKGITVRALVESIADEYGRRDLLHFGSRLPNPFDPPCIIGRRHARPSDP